MDNTEIIMARQLLWFACELVAANMDCHEVKKGDKVIWSWPVRRSQGGVSVQ